MPGRAEVIAGIALGTLFCAPAGAQPAAPDLVQIGSLPSTIDLTVAVSDLSAVRDTDAGRALERLFGEMSTWDRSTAAWADLARALRLEPDQAADALIGRHVILAMRGVSDPAGDRRTEQALLTTITPDVEARLREQLKPAPRGLTSNLPILALENGAFELATYRSPQPGDPARLLVAPRGSSQVFDELLPVLGGGTGLTTLSMMPCWRDVKSIADGPLLILYRVVPPGLSDQISDRDIQQPPDTETFFALSGRLDGSTCSAKFIASDSMLLPEPGAPGAWPAAVVEALERDALLLVAGSPDEQPAGNSSLILPLAGGTHERTLLNTLLSMMQLPKPLRDQLSGVAVVAIHAAPEAAPQDTRPALSITGVLPVSDLGEFATGAHDWIASFAGGEQPSAMARRLNAAPPQNIRILSLGPSAPGVLDGYLDQGGTIAWSFVPAQPAGGRTPGWWIVNIRTRAGEDAPASSTLAELSAQVAHPDQNARTLFRLVVRPAALVEMSRAAHPPAAPILADAARASAPRSAPEPRTPSALRWLDRVDTRLERARSGVLSGSVTLRMNTALLGGEQPRHHPRR